MKKIPTLFEREFANHRVVGISDKVHPGMEWVLNGEGAATVKWDGSCCAVIAGKFYKRFDAKPGRKIPEGAIPCCEPDPVTGHHPHWVPVDPLNAADKWFWKAMGTVCTDDEVLHDGTYEAVGPHFNGNPHRFQVDTLIPHGIHPVDVVRTFEDIRDYLEHHQIEGLVFWKDDEPMCKIKRRDFGFGWPVY